MTLTQGIVRAVPFISVVLLAACAGGGGMYSQPYALFEPEARSPVADTRPAYVQKIDGVGQTINRSDPVTPGVREVVVSIPGSPGMGDSKLETITIDAKPCMRYLLAARRSSPTARDWSAFVASVEPIGECQKKFAP
jgi:hypothetical protein